MLDWLKGGEPGYHVLEHCMRGDSLWSWVLAVGSALLWLGYLGVAFALGRAALASPPSRRRTLLGIMLAIFVLCGTIHLRATVSLWWPGYRLFALLLVPAVLSTYGFLALAIPNARELFAPEGDPLFESLWNAGGVGVTLVGLDWRFLRANAGVCELLGYDELALSRLTFADITHPDDLAKDLEMLRQLEEGLIEHYSLRKRYAHAEGGWVWARLTVSAARDESGAILYWIAQIVGIQDAVEERDQALLAAGLLRAELDRLRLREERSRAETDRAYAKLRITPPDEEGGPS